jgi:hypothetical protein
VTRNLPVTVGITDSERMLPVSHYHHDATGKPERRAALTSLENTALIASGPQSGPAGGPGARG